MARPVVRDPANAAWLDVFCKGGWKMKTPEGDYIKMTASNTRFRNAENTAWISFFCQVPPPTTIAKGNVRSNRIVDSNGFLWAAGYAVGRFSGKLKTSTKWSKCRYIGYVGGTEGEYIEGIKSLASVIGYDPNTGALDPRFPATTLFLHDKRILFSGITAGGLSGGSATQAQVEENNEFRYLVTDVTSAWANALGEGAKIVQHDQRGSLVLEDGTAFTAGYDSYTYESDPLHRYIRRVGYSGRRNNGITDGVTHTVGRITRFASWGRVALNTDAAPVPLIGITHAIRTQDHYTFMLTNDGRILQTMYWAQQTGGASSFLLYPPTIDSYTGMRDLPVPFPYGKVVALHTGGLAETENGDLYVYNTPTRLKPTDTKDFFHGFAFTPIGVNTKSFGVKVDRIVLNWEMAGTVQNHSLFIFLEDGRLYASGNNSSGWFGLPNLPKTNLNAPVLINQNVYDFDVDYGACILVKNDGSIWASGPNPSGRLGLGHLKNVTQWEQGVLE